MRLPSRKHIELAWNWEHVVSHSCAKGLDVPFLGAVEAQLAIEAFAVDLGRNLQKNHTRKAAAMGMGGVVIPSPLTVQPKIDGLQLIATRNPGAASLGRLAIHHVLDPMVASRQQMRVHQGLYTRLFGTEFPLLTQLPCQLARGIWTSHWVRKHALTQTEQGF